MKNVLASGVLKPEVLAEVERLSGQSVRECYQCGKCSAGCPIFGDPDGSDMDLPPNQVIRLLQLGDAEAALHSRTIWLCAGCETCTARCPREVDLAAVMEALRSIALEKGITSKGLRGIPLFDKLFLKNVRRFGRLFEMDLMGQFNMRTFNPFKDFFKAPGLFFKGRLGLFPSFKGRKTSSPAFEDAEQAKRRDGNRGAVATVRAKIKTRRKRKPKILAVINESCTGCASSPVCQVLCPVEDCMVLVRDEPDAPVFKRMTVDPLRCIGCKRCLSKGPDGIHLEGCPWNAIDMVDTRDFEAEQGKLAY